MALVFNTLLFSIDVNIVTITLNQPDKRNAFDDEVISELTRAFEAVRGLDDVRAVVLAANGSAFCAGANLNYMKAMANYSDEENLADAGKLAAMLFSIYSCPVPVIAKIQGDVYAGGMGLVAACDIAATSDVANFCLSEVRLGLIPATISPYVIAAMGERAARRYFLSAEVFSAQKALEIGFVHELVPAGDLDDAVLRIARGIVKNSPNAVRECKKLVQSVSGRVIDDGLIRETVESIAQIRASDEGREGVSSFLEKRKPSWIN